ncbi:nitrate reductase molybdenum cofactor assembly chaperone [Xanthobacter dioxanivorans]|uniref:Nitrate reductase molybdenum cofactor assembly chaperone n=2 Tax=Xanthobacter dioxanivorans TaxID=2528964 RepID=A0A974SLZ1_9HYPH|nr:nitrate reductase molybdenum cofactor assembly chaperone [Xanthobacter dioxanivorans]QRG09849.1 nitrate reductase molybdenum cofactor assembly chaperone [Xanthobacter dioxanivorans]
MQAENLTFRALSALLAYPSEDLVAAAPAIADVLALEGLVGEPARAGLAPLLEELAQDDLFALQESYVGLFDRTRRLSLHLFEHVHGESRDRGQAMVDLAGIYEKGGLVLVANELPDYLPLFLEFLSTRPLAEARGLIADIVHILASLEERLAARGSAYAAVFAALRTLATDGVVAAPASAPAKEEPVDDLAALDAAWEETAVTFGPGEGMGACSVDRFRTQLRAAQRDARHTAA